MKHAERARRYHIPEHKEAGFAESTIGILEARGIIGIDQAEMCKRLANLRSVLFGDGNPRGSSVENVSRATGAKDGDTKWMRDNWMAYKVATDGLEKANVRLFEHVIMRNNPREWMKLADDDLFVAMASTGENRADNSYRAYGTEAGVVIKARMRELRLILSVIVALTTRLPRQTPPAGTDGYTRLSQAQRDALDGGPALLDKLYAAKGER